MADFQTCTNYRTFNVHGFVLQFAILLAAFSHLPQVRCQQSNGLSPNKITVYWNSTTFLKYKSTSTGYVIQANLYDQLNIICASSPGRGEHYSIYYTAEEEAAKTCDLAADPRSFPLFLCSNPAEPVANVITLAPMHPIYLDLVFMPGNKYYFFSTSTMQPSGIGNKKGGACETNGAKITLDIACLPPDCDAATTTTSTSASATSITSTTNTTETSSSTHSTSQQPSSLLGNAISCGNSRFQFSHGHEALWMSAFFLVVCQYYAWSNECLRAIV